GVGDFTGYIAAFAVLAVLLLGSLPPGRGRRPHQPRHGGPPTAALAAPPAAAGTPPQAAAAATELSES
ncbi:hypothetical protein, partial [Stenotrophomonas acidaminiphila]|uniref:hypothetical protein n=1 Tax=Stenotrophomonas acidaminiphila TaxID=128780 RepID=UPI001ED8C841